jgi:ABC-type transport system involved in multi-copper enzyme maturation permease subunit
MNALRLLDLEWFKARHSFAFRVTMFFFFGVLLIGYGGEYYFATRRAPQVSALALADSVGFLQGIGMMLILVLIVLLTGNEKTWRTERQNVIDGLSRDQYFVGKLLLLFLCVLILWLGAGLVDTVFAALQRPLALEQRPLFAEAATSRFAQMLLYLLLSGAVGLLFATITSSSGAGLALAFVLMLGQMPIIAKLSQMGGVWQESAQYFPMRILMMLGNTTNDSAELLRQNTIARERGMWLTLSTNATVMMALVYSALFAAGAWLSIRRRDL